MTGNTPYPSGFGAPPPATGPPQPGGPGYSHQPPGQFPSAKPLARSWTGLLAGAVAVAVLLGVAALVLSIIALTRGAERQPLPTPPKAEPQELFVDDADKSLCEAISPLMREASDRTN